MSIHPPHMKNSPSAFIQFCEYNGDMLSVGEHMDTFPLPVCTAFTPTVLQGQLCYTFDPDTVQANISSHTPSLMFLLDYNQDRDHFRIKDDKEDVEESNPQDTEAMIYIHTLSKTIHTHTELLVQVCSF